MRHSFVIFYLIVLTASSQTEIHGNADLNGNTLGLNPYNGLIVKRAMRNDKVQGHPYYEEKARYAKVYEKDVLKRNYKIRYNAFTDEIEVFEKETGYILKKTEGLKIALDDYQYEIHKIDGKETYLVIHVEGELQLMTRMIKKIKKEIYPKNGYDKYQLPKYVLDSEYYIKNGGGELKNVDLKKRDIKPVFEKHAEDLSKFIKENNLSYRNLEDVIMMFNHYNSLIKN